MTDDAVIFGEALIDVVVTPDGATAEHVGGSPANVALGLGLLGRPVTLSTQYGNDGHGRLIDDRLRGSGVAIEGGLRTDITTSTAIATLDEAGVAQYSFELSWDGAGVSPSSQPPLVAHAGSLGAYLKPGADAVLDRLRELRTDATITADPNLRPSIMDRARALEQLEALVAVSDVVKVSDEDIAWLHPDADPAEITRSWLAQGPALVILTEGHKGSRAWTGAEHAATVPPTVSVVDTVGAGDAFMSGLIDGLWSLDLLGRGRRGALESIDSATVQALLEHASRSAAVCVARAGAQPPTRAELPELKAPDGTKNP